MEEKKRKRWNILDTWDGEYQGNVFGPKVALWGGLFILAMVIFAVYRHVSLGVPFGGAAPDKIELNEQVKE